jgi:hypothetical protein
MGAITALGLVFFVAPKGNKRIKIKKKYGF